MGTAYAPPPAREQLQACLLAALFALLFLGPALLPGRALVPYPPEFYEIFAAQRVAAGEELPPMRGNASMGDKYNQSLAWDRILQDSLRAGDVPEWSNDIGGGVPFVPQMAQVWQPWNALLFAVPGVQAYGPWYFLHLLAFGWLGYLFFRAVGCAHPSGLFGVTVAVLGLWTQCKLHHNVILTGALSLWPMLLCVHVLFRHGGAARTAGLLALATGLSWMSGFAVVSLQVSYFVVAYALLLCLLSPKGRRLRPLLWAGGGMALGGLLSLCQMGPVLVASSISSREAITTAELAGRSLEWDYLLTAVWPDLLHWAEDVFYPPPAITRPPWIHLVLTEGELTQTGYNWVECSFAIGIPGLLAALLAFADRERRHLAYFAGGVALFGFGLAACTFPFFELGHLLPGLLATDLKRNLFLVAMSLTLLAALGADVLLRGRAPRWVPVPCVALALVSATFGLWVITLGPDLLADAIAGLAVLDGGDPRVQALDGDASRAAAMIRGAALPGEAEANLAALRTTFLRATLVAALSAGALFLLRGPRLVAALIALTAAELLHAGRAGVVAVEAERITTPPAVVKPVLAAEPEAPGVAPRLQRLGRFEEGRVGTLYPPNLGAFHGIEDGSSYSPLPPSRMESFFLAVEPDEEGTGKPSVVFDGAGVRWFFREASLQHPLLDLFGVRFVLATRELDLPGHVERTPPDAGPPFRLYERTTCLPRATFVSRARIVTDRDERLRELSRPERDVAAEVLLEEPDAPVPQAGEHGQATVEVVAREAERVRIRVRNPVAGYLRLADPWDPGWRATVDGEERRVWIADHYLRAVHLEPGEHDVVFTYDGSTVVWPPRASGIALLAIVGLLLWPRRRLAPNAEAAA